MKYSRFVLFGTMLLAFCANAQTNSNYARTSNIMRQYNSQGGLSSAPMIMNMSSLTPSTIEGDPYWDEHWNETLIVLYGSEDAVQGGYVTKYDIKGNQFEVKVGDDIKVLPGARVKSVVWTDSITKKPRRLINAKDFKQNQVAMEGFFEVLVEEEHLLLRKTWVELLKPDFNPALNVGSKNSRLTKHIQFYFSKGQDVELIRTKSDLKPLFGDRFDTVDTYAKSHRLKYNKEADLVDIFGHFFSLRDK